jgi:hypothetical protein
MFFAGSLLLLRTYYAIWNILRDFYHLFGMANLVSGNEGEPRVKIQTAEEWMRPAKDTQVAAMCLFQER